MGNSCVLAAAAVVGTLSEIERGIRRQRHVSPTFAEALTHWLDRVLQSYSDRLLPVGVAEARRWGILSGELGHAGADLLIAATALEHGLMVVTRNRRHFSPTGVEVLDPFRRLVADQEVVQEHPAMNLFRSGNESHGSRDIVEVIGDDRRPDLAAPAAGTPWAATNASA